MSLVINCEAIVRGSGVASYSDQYVTYLNFFCTLGHSHDEVLCENVPQCWAPFVRYLGHRVGSTASYADIPGWESDFHSWGDFYQCSACKRRAVEIVSTCRPELVHALYCADTEWPCPRRERSASKQFLVTCNGSFFRDEVMAYRKRLQKFVPTRRRAVVVPCSATKPYPSDLHRAVMERIDPARWHVVVATGVLGLVPQELWEGMPEYDAGLPYLERCQKTVRWYFRRHSYEAVVVYSDFYATAVREGLRGSGTPARYVLGHHYRDLYENLLLDERLMSLSEAVSEMDKPAAGHFSGGSE